MNRLAPADLRPSDVPACCGESSDRHQIRPAAPYFGDTGGDAARYALTLSRPTPALSPEAWRPRTSVDRSFGIVPGPSTSRCPVDFALNVIGDRRRIVVLWHLFWGARPYGELMRLLVGVSKRNLRHELVALERSGLIRRVVRDDGQRRAQYMLSEFGETLKPILGALYEWGLNAQGRRSHVSSTTAREENG
jgi:DNA-binding HxlR family transcriptional regulator